MFAWDSHWTILKIRGGIRERSPANCILVDNVSGNYSPHHTSDIVRQEYKYKILHSVPIVYLLFYPFRAGNCR